MEVRFLLNFLIGEMLLEDNKGDLIKRVKLILVYSCVNLFYWICNVDGVNE